MYFKGSWLVCLLCSVLNAREECLHVLHTPWPLLSSVVKLESMCFLYTWAGVLNRTVGVIFLLLWQRKGLFWLPVWRGNDASSSVGGWLHLTHVREQSEMNAGAPLTSPFQKPSSLSSLSVSSSFCVCMDDVCARGVPAVVHVWQPKNNLVELIFLLPYVDSGDQTQACQTSAFTHHLILALLALVKMTSASLW